jgi:hypothetical protein
MDLYAMCPPRYNGLDHLQTLELWHSLLPPHLKIHESVSAMWVSVPMCGAHLLETGGIHLALTHGTHFKNFGTCLHPIFE